MATIRDGKADQILDLAFDAIFTFRLDDGRISYWNRGAERTYGWTAEEAIGQRPEELLKSAHQLPRESVVREVVETGQWHGEMMQRHRDGRFVVVEGRWALERDPAGNPVGVLEVNRDITEQRRAQEQQRANERARSEFLNLAAHELRSPVTVISGYLSMVTEGTLGHPDPETRQVLEVLRAKVAELSDMIEEMVEGVRFEEGSIRLDLHTLNLNDLVSRSIHTASLVADPRHKLEVELPPQPVRVRADPRRLQLVVGSLVATALKLAPARGEVKVRVHQNDQRVTVELRDAGLGLSTDEVARLFERFERADSGGRIAGGGAGLGLYLARGLARMHGGDVTVSSRGNRGSTFTLSLPRAPASARGRSS